MENGKTMDLKKNQEIELHIDDLGKDGEGIGHVDGYALFVKGALPGETVKVGITKLRKNFGFARLIEILVPSKDRVEPRCKVAGPCGGCTLQHLSYEGQLLFKQKKVEDCLSRIGGVDLSTVEMNPILGMEGEPWHYRNKAQFPIRKDKAGKPVAGFFAGRSHNIIPMTDCQIQDKFMKKILDTLLETMEKNHILAYDEENHQGIIRHIFIRRGFTSGETMVCLVANMPLRQFMDKYQQIFVEAFAQFPEITSLIVNMNTQRTNVILGDREALLSGKEFLEDNIGDIHYLISPKSFYQVNPAQTIRLYETALSFANLTGKEVVWDMYCGIGTISLFLARKAKVVYGVEIVDQAIDDARMNAIYNDIKNVKYFCGAAEDIVSSKGIQSMVGKEAMNPDVVVVDPPRKGCDTVLLDTILTMKPKRIVYVSCDPATLARDVKILGEGKDQCGYQVTKVQPVDMFPGTGHVETVVLMSRAQK